MQWRRRQGALSLWLDSVIWLAKINLRGHVHVINAYDVIMYDAMRKLILISDDLWSFPDIRPKRLAFFRRQSDEITTLYMEAIKKCSILFWFMTFWVIYDIVFSELWFILHCSIRLLNISQTSCVAQKNAYPAWKWWHAMRHELCLVLITTLRSSYFEYTVFRGDKVSTFQTILWHRYSHSYAKQVSDHYRSFQKIPRGPKI